MKKSKEEWQKEHDEAVVKREQYQHQCQRLENRIRYYTHKGGVVYTEIRLPYRTLPSTETAPLFGMLLSVPNAARKPSLHIVLALSVMKTI